MIERERESQREPERERESVREIELQNYDGLNLDKQELILD